MSSLTQVCHLCLNSQSTFCFLPVTACSATLSFIDLFPSLAVSLLQAFFFCLHSVLVDLVPLTSASRCLASTDPQSLLSAKPLFCLSLLHSSHHPFLFSFNIIPFLSDFNGITFCHYSNACASQYLAFYGVFFFLTFLIFN